MGRSGYLQVELSKNGTSKIIPIHKLVGLHFLKNPQNKPQIDHIDRNRYNNNVINLRWVNSRENNCNRLDTSEYGHNIYFYQGRKKPWMVQIRIENNLYTKSFTTHVRSN